MTREDEIEQRLNQYRQLEAPPPFDDELDYLLARVRQLEGRLPVVAVDLAAVRERLDIGSPEYDSPFPSVMISALTDELDHWRAKYAELQAVVSRDLIPEDERIAMVQRLTAEECCKVIRTTKVNHGDLRIGMLMEISNDADDLVAAVSRRFGLEEQR